MAHRRTSVTTTTIDSGWMPMGFPPITVFDVAGDIILESVHDPVLCKGEFCPFHNPSDHHMRDWTMTFDPPLVYRYCPHMQPHPDPDSVRHADRAGLTTYKHSQCDGCCQP